MYRIKPGRKESENRETFWAWLYMPSRISEKLFHKTKLD